MKYQRSKKVGEALNFRNWSKQVTILFQYSVATLDASNLTIYKSKNAVPIFHDSVILPT